MEKYGDSQLNANIDHKDTVDIGQAIISLQDLSGMSEKNLKCIREDTDEGLIFLAPSKRQSNNRLFPVFQRKKESVLQQPQFDSQVDQISLVPVRGELSNMQLCSFLRSVLLENKYKRTGIVFLLNDSRDDQRASDSTNMPVAVQENQLTAAFLSSVIQEDTTAIDMLPISSSYRTLGDDLVQSGAAQNIRYDYVTAIQEGLLGSPHFGALRAGLIDLARIFKNSSVASDDTIIHLMDVDTTVPTDHFKKLETWYKSDPNRKANVSEWDLTGGSYTGRKPNKEIEPQIEETRASYRTWRYAEEVNNLLLGRYWESTPTISGKLSYFLSSNQHQVSPRDELMSSYHDEDYRLTDYLKRHLGAELGHVGEVLLSDRATDSRFLGAESDSQRRLDFIYRLKKGSLKVYAVNPDFEHKFRHADWREKQEMHRPETSLINFSKVNTAWLRHTEEVISKELLCGNQLADDPVFKRSLGSEKDLESSKLAQQGKEPALNVTHKTIARLRAIKSFLLEKNLSLFP